MSFFVSASNNIYILYFFSSPSTRGCRAVSVDFVVKFLSGLPARLLLCSVRSSLDVPPVCIVSLSMSFYFLIAVPVGTLTTATVTDVARVVVSTTFLPLFFFFRHIFISSYNVLGASIR